MAQTENYQYIRPNLKFLGLPYPIVKHPLGFLHTQSGLNQIKSDLLVLLLTNPGERIMMSEFGTPLRRVLFEQGDAITALAIKQTISNSIKTWEPRVNIQAIDVTIGSDINYDQLDSNFSEERDNIAFISIVFTDLNELTEIQELKLQIPLSGT
jgi:phage baseplate assembly protein W